MLSVYNSYVATINFYVLSFFEVPSVGLDIRFGSIKYPQFRKVSTEYIGLGRYGSTPSTYWVLWGIDMINWVTSTPPSDIQ
jgi:hypothetical protein